MGNARLAVADHELDAVHPHARGERPASSTCSIVVRWFIPTPVGNALDGSNPSPRHAVHPHARGERATDDDAGGQNLGSSPRPWGTHVRRDHQRALGRFIPTPVGNAPNGRSGQSPTPVHPHARGERSRVLIEHQAERGSSPRPWGTPWSVIRQRIGSRFIPTPVGNAPSKSLTLVMTTVHPHARGERSSPPSAAALAFGSSPRPWGTRARPITTRAVSRFIPTPVGNARPASDAA